MIEFLLAIALFILYLGLRERIFLPLYYTRVERFVMAGLIAHYFLFDGGMIYVWLISIFAFRAVVRINVRMTSTP